MLLISVLLLLSSSVTLASSQDVCNYELVESMPDQLQFNQTLNFKPTSTHEALIDMAKEAKYTLRIASFYWTLTPDDEFIKHPSTLPGQNLMKAIVDAVDRGVNLEVILDNSSRKSMSNERDVKKLAEIGTLRYLNMTQLLKAGVLHTKLMIADNETTYVGSSNFDWRSYTQIKEIGIKFNKCQVLSQDFDKIFRTYMYMSKLGYVPESLPESLKTDINIDHPIELQLNGQEPARLFLGGSPPAFNGVKQWIGRTDDIDGLLHVLDNAKHQVDVSVMNYSPRTGFVWPKRYWPRIDDAFRRAAAERGVRVRLLFSDWSHTSQEELMWYRSLNTIQSKALHGAGIHVKLFKVPAFDDFQRSIPYARVKHDKYMVTDDALYIGTSNWVPDYFINTCGIGVVIEPTRNGQQYQLEIIKNMQSLFERDFESSFAHEI